jgi:internalin A
MEREELLRLIDQAADEQWTELDLVGEQITEIPMEIGNLTNLTSLNLCWNQIVKIPLEIEKLINLTSLNLSWNQITEIPVSIGKLNNLTYLDLQDNQITNISRSIENLTNLINLDLRNNKITDISRSIEKLINLTDLNLGGNQITKIPMSIEELTNLTHLDLGCNQITEIPAEICDLTNLTNLGLWENQITNIPTEIEKLTNLTRLALGCNQITEIPVEIEKLTNLTCLYLRNNRITKIPHWFQSFENLKVIDLRGNPIPIPPEILDNKFLDEPGDLRGILSFYFQTQDPNATKPLYEAKFIIVGEGESGKTTLAKKLQDSDYELNPNEKSTHGINIIRWEFTQPNGKPFRVNIWDFGGQEIYHATHQFFLTERSLYTLLADDRENPNCYYWLNFVRLLSDNSPVFIIKNEKGEIHCQFNEGQLRCEFEDLQNSVRANLATNRGLEDIKKAIQTHITALPHIHQPIPKPWVRIRNRLENYSQNQNYISVEEYRTLCKTNGIKDQKEMLIISKYLHDLGICLHFQKDRVLKNWVILNPIWATNAVYKVTETDAVKDSNGCFTEKDLATIWHDSQYTQMHDELLQLMQNFGICYPIRNIADTYIAPSLLSLTQPDYIWNETDNLILRYEYEFMPKGIVTRFIVEMHNLIEGQPEPAPATSQLVWKEGVILTDSRARAEVIEFYDKREIRIRVVGFQKKTLLDCIRHEFQKIHDSYERLKYEELIPCNCAICKDTQTPYTYTLQSLLKRLENGKFTVECDESYESINVRRLIDEVIEPMRDDSGITPSQQKRLEKEGDSLQSALDLRTDKLDVLRKDLAIATDPSIKFKLEKEIADEEEKIQELITRLDEIEQQLNNKSSFGNTRSIRAKPRTPADSPSASIVNHNYNINKVENMTGNITQNAYGDGDNIARDKVMRDKIGTQINNAQNLAQAVVEIQALLDNLAELYNPNSETGQAKIAKEAIESIDRNPTLKGRIINAIKESSYTALEEAVDRPAVKILMAAFKGFTEGK